MRRFRPAQRISDPRTEDAVFTRCDTLAAMRVRLPKELELAGVRGVRVLTPVPQLLRLPLIGAAEDGVLGGGRATAPRLRRLPRHHRAEAGAGFRKMNSICSKPPTQ